MLLIGTGGFGRTPRLEPMNGRSRRDHWSPAMSILVASGGVRMDVGMGNRIGFGKQGSADALAVIDACGR